MKIDRNLGLVGLAATGICSMLGASIYIVPFMIQRNVPDIGPYVILSFVIAALPAMLAAIAYSSLSTALPFAGGSYLYVSKGLNKYLGFVASFSQWFGLSIVIGVISYVIIPFFRDAATAFGLTQLETFLSNDGVRLVLALILLWVFVFVNIVGMKSYERIVIPLMILMFFLGIIVIVIGFSHNQDEFLLSIKAKPDIYQNSQSSFSWKTILSGAALLFASFIGFDSISQAGSDAKNPARNLPLAIAATILLVGLFYIVFTTAVYHTVPWQYVKEQAFISDVTAPGLLAPILNPTIAALIILGAAIALLNDLPAMLLSVSRLMYAWSVDKIFPQKLASLHHKYHTPHNSIIIAGVFASIGIIGSYLASDFFMGVDIMVTSMLVNFLIVCVTLFSIDSVNPSVAEKITFIRSTALRKLFGVIGSIGLTIFLIIHTYKDLTSTKSWFLKSTPIWLIVMLIGTIIFIFNNRNKQ